MKGRYFWEKRTLKKYRIVFETSEIVVGATKKNKFKTFRKDTETIAFSRREVLEMKISDLTRYEEKKDENSNFKQFDNPAFGFNFG